MGCVWRPGMDNPPMPSGWLVQCKACNDLVELPFSAKVNHTNYICSECEQDSDEV